MLFKAYGSLLKNTVWRVDAQWFTWCFKEIGEKLGGEEVNSQDFIKDWKLPPFWDHSFQLGQTWPLTFSQSQPFCLQKEAEHPSSKETIYYTSIYISKPIYLRFIKFFTPILTV